MPTREQLAQQHYRPVPRRQSAQPLPSPRTVGKLPRPVQRQTADVYDEEDEEEKDDDLYPQRSRSSVVVRRPYPPAPVRDTDIDQHEPAGKQRKHWLFYAGLIFTIMLAGWLLFSMLGSWIQSKLDDFTYGYPRTYQVDQDVGHFGRVSHFLCLNLNGQPVEKLNC